MAGPKSKDTPNPPTNPSADPPAVSADSDDTMISAEMARRRVAVASLPPDRAVGDFLVGDVDSDDEPITTVADASRLPNGVNRDRYQYVYVPVNLANKSNRLARMERTLKMNYVTPVNHPNIDPSAFDHPDTLRGINEPRLRIGDVWVAYCRKDRYGEFVEALKAPRREIVRGMLTGVGAKPESDRQVVSYHHSDFGASIGPEEPGE